MIRYTNIIVLISVVLAGGSIVAAADAPAPATQPAASTATDELQATVVSVKGSAQQADGDDAKPVWAPLKAGQVLSEHALVRTGLGAKVVLRFSDRSEVTIKSATKIGIRDSRKEGDVAHMGVGLKYGTVKAKINRAAGPNDFKIHTPVATLSVRGSAGTTSYSAGFGMQFHSLQSTWNVRTPQGSVGVVEGAATDGNLTANRELSARQNDSRISDPFGVGGGEARNVRDNANPVDPFNPVGGTNGAGLNSYGNLGESIHRSDCPIPIPPSPGHSIRPSEGH